MYFARLPDYLLLASGILEEFNRRVNISYDGIAIGDICGYGKTTMVAYCYNEADRSLGGLRKVFIK